MFTGLDPDTTNDTRAVGRLLAAGILAQDKAGLRTTPRWHDRMLQQLQAHPDDEIQESLIHSLRSTLPGAPDKEIDVLARIMLFIEAREAGWNGE